VFQIERTQEVTSCWTIAPCRRRVSGTPPGAALERFITSALVLALAAERQGDLFGLVGSAIACSPSCARAGKAHYDACRDDLHARAADRHADFEESRRVPAPAAAAACASHCS